MKSAVLRCAWLVFLFAAAGCGNGKGEGDADADLQEWPDDLAGDGAEIPPDSPDLPDIRDADAEEAQDVDHEEGTNLPLPEVYPLELLFPRQPGTAPSTHPDSTTMPAGHRIFRAYPGLEYNVRAAVIGGSYPYRFSLADAPEGMTVDPVTGEIAWPDPQSDAAPTLTVTDSLGSSVSESWSVTVTTEGFHFVDSVNGRNHPTGDGSITNPWANLVDLYNAPGLSPSDIVYFRSGTYVTTGLPRSSSDFWLRCELRAPFPQTLIAYPGESPLIDFDYPSGDGASLAFEGLAYIDGFETRNSRNHALELHSGDHFQVFRRLRMHDHNPLGEDLDGQNPGMIYAWSWGEAVSEARQYCVFQDNEFYNAPLDGAYKLYGLWKPLVEDNYCHDLRGCFDPKAGVARFTFRGCTLDNVGVGVHGNMNNSGELYASGEVLYNRIINAVTWPLEINNDSSARQIDVYRNTIVGGEPIVERVDGEDGPFYFYNNVIVNDVSGTPEGSHITQSEVTDPSRIILSDNLAGYPADGIVDAGGGLTPGYASYLGTHGCQIP